MTTDFDVIFQRASKLDTLDAMVGFQAKKHGIRHDRGATLGGNARMAEKDPTRHGAKTKLAIALFEAAERREKTLQAPGKQELTDSPVAADPVLSDGLAEELARWNRASQ